MEPSQQNSANVRSAIVTANHPVQPFYGTTMSWQTSRLDRMRLCVLAVEWPQTRVVFVRPIAGLPINLGGAGPTPIPEIHGTHDAGVPRHRSAAACRAIRSPRGQCRYRPEPAAARRTDLLPSD